MTAGTKLLSKRIPTSRCAVELFFVLECVVGLLVVLVFYEATEAVLVDGLCE